MTSRGSVLFIAIIGYVGSIALLVWINTAVLCLGDPKFDDGCGGFDLYFLVWVISFAPLGILATALAVRSAPNHHATCTSTLLAIYAVVILLGVEVSFIFDAKWPWLLAEYAIGAALLVIVYRVTTGRFARMSVVASGEDRQHEA